MSGILIFEFLWIVLFIFCVKRCMDRSELYRLLDLILAVPYGLALELFALRAGAYTYGPFLFKIFGAPLSIAFGWAVIIYTVMEITNHFKIYEWYKPLAEGFMTLGFDLVFDPVCVSLGFWTFNFPGVWFNVPLQNFLGWLFFPIFYSYCARYFYRIKPVSGPLLAIGSSIACMLAYSLLIGATVNNVGLLVFTSIALWLTIFGIVYVEKNGGW